MLKSGTRLSDTVLITPVQGIDENGIEKTFTLSAFWGENIVLYFCPMDDSPECADEAKDFNLHLKAISQKATVICVSPDGIARHRQFQEELDLNFILLSDTDYRIIKAFGVWGEKEIMGIKVLGVIRSTFLIGKDGVIKHAWPKVDIEGHVDEVIRVLNLLD